MFDLDYRMQDVWVEGEVSNFSQPASGHWYFTLKDERSQLKAVMWKSSAVRQDYIPEHGEKVRAHGKLGVYEASGQYQLYCDTMIPLEAVGSLHMRFRQLWDQLEAEGLFREEIKRPLPAFPRRIGVVTSITAAAFQDIQNVLRRRYPLANVILSPTPVQGDDAAPKIVAALRLIDQYGVDVILLARGGGSLEDLWCFNDERIARIIRELNTPVVTGVGHETDTTLVDGAADRRAPTPSAGAEMITPDLDDVRERLDELKIRMAEATQYAITVRRDDLNNTAHKLRLVSPAARIRNDRQRLDELDSAAGQSHAEPDRGGAAVAQESGAGARTGEPAEFIGTRLCHRVAGDGRQAHCRCEGRRAGYDDQRTVEQRPVNRSGQGAQTCRPVIRNSALRRRIRNSCRLSISLSSAISRWTS